MNDMRAIASECFSSTCGRHLLKDHLSSIVVILPLCHGGLCVSLLLASVFWSLNLSGYSFNPELVNAVLWLVWKVDSVSPLTAVFL